MAQGNGSCGRGVTAAAARHARAAGHRELLDGAQARVLGEPLERVRLKSPFLLRSVTPPLVAAEGRRVVGLRRLGKRLVFSLEGELFLLLHLMIAGRLRWRKRGARPPGRIGMAAFDFPAGTLVLTEASKKKRAALHLVAGEEELARHDPLGLEVLESDREAFAARLRLQSHTLKRALTDPRLFSGIGNAYSAASSPTGPSPGCSGTTGRERWRSWRRFCPR